MIPWIQVYSNLIKHPKTYALADELKLTSKDVTPNAVAAGMMVSLWLWAAQNATDGDLSKCSARAIAEAAEYKKDPVTFVAALKKTRWLDNDGKLHDWDEYATLLIDCDQQQRENTRKRVQRHRAKKKAAGNNSVTPGCNAPGNVTVTPCNAPTIPNHTLPYHTNLYDVDSDESAGAERAIDEYLQWSGISVEDYFVTNPALKEALYHATLQLFDSLGGRQATKTDAAYVLAMTRSYQGGIWVLDTNRLQLLTYCFEQASRKGCPANWKYIGGCMRNLDQRGIKTIADIEDYELGELGSTERSCEG